MDTRLLEPDVLYVLLPPEPQLQPELAALRDRMVRMKDMHLVLDLSGVDLITSPSTGSLLLLQRLLAQRGRRMVLCRVCLATQCIFRIIGLDKFVETAENESEALLAVRRVPEPPVENR